METTKQRAKTPWVAVVLTLLVSLGLNLVLGASEFEEAYRTALVNKFGISVKTIKTQVENSMSLGKPLHLFGDSMGPLFAEARNQDSGIGHLYITNSVGTILYATRPGTEGREMPVLYSKGSANPSKEALFATETTRAGDSVFVSIPLYRISQFYEGHLFLEFNQSLISNSILTILLDLGLTSLVTFALTLLVFVLVARLFSLLGRPLTARGTVVWILVVLFLSQGYYGVTNNRYYSQAYTQVYNANMTALSQSVRGDFDKVFSYGLPVERLKGAETFLAERLKGNPESSNLYVFDSQGKVLYQSGEAGTASVLEPSQAKLANLTLPAAVRTLAPGSPPLAIEGIVYVALLKGVLALEINRTLIDTRLGEQSLDSLTIAIVSLIVAFMLLELLRLNESRALLTVAQREQLKQEGTTGLRFIRLACFIFTFGAFVPLAFLPQHIQQIYDASPIQLFQWNSDIMVSVPMGTYMIGITAAMLLSIFVFRFLTLRTRYILISVFFVAGTLMTVLAKDILWMSLARFIAGMGFGGALLATTSLVTAFTDEKRRSSGFGIAAAGFAAATLCSVPIGGVIVNRLGTEAGLYTAIAFGILFLAFILFFLKTEAPAAPEVRKGAKLTVGQWTRILFSRHILTYTFFMNIPFQVLYWGLLQYVLPLYMSNSLGFSEANIGRILSLFCIISLFAAFASRLADRLMNDKLLLAFGSVTVGLALLLFNFVPEGGLALFIGVIVAMGIQNLFVDSIEEVFVSKGRVPVAVDEETLLQSYKTVEKVLSIFVPTLSGILFLVAGFNNAMFLLGVFTLAGAVLFFVFAQNGRTRIPATEGVLK